MKNYDRVNSHRPEGIEGRHAHILGGGIAGLSTAAFLIVDGHMPAANITIYEQRPVVGGSMDGAGNPEEGYISRGERELEPYMECLWYLCAMIPSLEEPGRTVLDETRECNRDNPIHAKKRLFARNMAPHDISDLGLSQEHKEKLLKLMLTPEGDIEDLTIQDWFPNDFFTSNLWYYWSSMLAFQPFHSLIEMKRYTVRFMQHLDGIENLKGILRTKYDQHSSLIEPLRAWLQGLGVHFSVNTTITDIQLAFEGKTKTVTSFESVKHGTPVRVNVSPRDLVFFTNGSMTQASTYGDNERVATLNTSPDDLGSFAVWSKLAQTSPVFGRPEKFISRPEKSNFISFTITVRDCPALFDYIEQKTESTIGSAGIMTLVDSAWFMSINCPPQPAFKGQPADVQVLWGYGLRSDQVGDYIRKPMLQCTGAEIFQELLYHLGLIDQFDTLLAHTKIRTCMLPYITSQFMPRSLLDRPQIIPEGCTNLALIGQFVELAGDVVFTVETSVRTAMIAVYKLLHLDKPITPLFEGQYDVRIIVACLKKMLGVSTLTYWDLLPNSVLKLPGSMGLALELINSMPAIPDCYPELTRQKE